jgi:biotin transport system substrate-specific component
MIPFTLQPVAVLMAGAVLGARLGAASQALYLAAGIVGASMFAWSPVLLPGAARLLGPTGGFLMAFPVAAFVTGLLAERGLARHYAGAALSMLAGAVALYAGGIAWAMVTLPGASFAAFLPFAAADLAKVLLMAAAVPALRRAFAR